MKKLITLFIVLSILVPAAFAQDEGTFTWGGQVRAQYDVTDTASGLAGGDNTLELTGTYKKGPLSVIGTISDPDVLDSNVNMTAGLAPHLALEFVAADADATYKADFKMSNSTVITGIESFVFYDTIDTLYGWGYVLDKQLRAELSYKGGDVLWATPGPIAKEVDTMGDGGIRFVYYPDFLKGFNAGIRFASPFTAGVNNLTDWFQAGTVIGAKYVSPDTSPADQLTVSAVVKITNTLDTIAGGAKFLLSSSFSVKGDVVAEVDAEKYSFALNAEYAQTPLTAGGTFKLENLGDKPNADLVINPYVKYVLVTDVVLADLNVAFTQGLQDNTKSLLEFTPRVSVSYKGAVAAGLDAYSGFFAAYTLGFNLDADDVENKLSVGFKHVF
jgi:hypothetical protein